MGALVATVQSFSQLAFIAPMLHRESSISLLLLFSSPPLLSSSPSSLSPRVTSSWRGFALYFSDFLLV